MVAILQDVSAEGRYIGMSLIIWTFPMSTMSLIMVPKMMVVRSQKLGIGKHGASRGSRDHITVTGLHLAVPQPPAATPEESTTEPPSSNVMGRSRGVMSPRMQVVTME